MAVRVTVLVVTVLVVTVLVVTVLVVTVLVVTVCVTVVCRLRRWVGGAARDEGEEHQKAGLHRPRVAP